MQVIDSTMVFYLAFFCDMLYNVCMMFVIDGE